MARAYPDGTSPRALERGRWVKDGRGVKRWKPDKLDVEERKTIAHLAEHGDTGCSRCMCGLLLSRRSEHTRDNDGIIPGRVIKLSSGA